MVKDSIDICIKHLEFIENILNEINHSQKGKELANAEAFFMLQIDRLYQYSKSLHVLLDNYKTLHNSDFSLALILRAALLDMLLTIYLRIIEEANKDLQKTINDYDIICFDMLIDGTKFIIDETANDYSDDFLSKEELEKFFNQMVALYPAHFNHYKFDGSKPEVVKHQYYSATTIRRKIKSSKIWNRLGVNVYNRYSAFSKYDHFTSFFYHLNRQPELIRTERLASSIEYLIFHVHLLTDISSKINPVFIPELFSQRALTYISDNQITIR